jgi:GrpB-like predicted nucleotidyltransferase (UPF0157 family)
VISALADYNPNWPVEFASAANDILHATRADWLIEHIGSTSIPGMCAKPVIDLAVRVDRLSDVHSYGAALRSAGFVAIAAGPRTHLVRVRLANGRRTHIAHFFSADRWDACNQRIFRDWLITHAEDRDLYANAKRAAAAEATGSRDYTARKTSAVQDIVDRARAARGLRPVDVWDK